MSDDDPLTDAVGLLADRGLAVEVAGRTIRLTEPVQGDAGAAALRHLGLMEAASPVGIATHGETQVAAAVWQAPRAYVARWSRNRWIVGYRLAGGSRLNDYLRSEGRIPGHLETGHWYETVPEEVSSAFAEVGLSLEVPPFPVPPQPPAEKRPARAGRSTSRTEPGGRAPRPAARQGPPRAPAPRRAAAPKAPPAPKPPPPTSQVCSGCHMRRSLTQFEAGSDLCNDCRA